MESYVKAGIKSHIPTLLIPQLLWKGFIIWEKNQGLRPHTNRKHNQAYEAFLSSQEPAYALWKRLDRTNTGDYG